MFQPYHKIVCPSLTAAVSVLAPPNNGMLRGGATTDTSGLQFPKQMVIPAASSNYDKAKQVDIYKYSVIAYHISYILSDLILHPISYYISYPMYDPIS